MQAVLRFHENGEVDAGQSQCSHSTQSQPRMQYTWATSFKTGVSKVWGGEGGPWSPFAGTRPQRPHKKKSTLQHKHKAEAQHLHLPVPHSPPAARTPILECVLVTLPAPPRRCQGRCPHGKRPSPGRDSPPNHGAPLRRSPQGSWTSAQSTTSRSRVGRRARGCGARTLPSTAA
jgi:hypothetical protein